VSTGAHASIDASIGAKIGYMAGEGFRPADGERRCTARNSRGEQCRKWAIKGALVCRAHSGATRQVRAAAGRRLADAQARELGRRADIEVPEFSTPGTAARYLLAQAGARVLQWGALADGAGPAVYADRAGRKHVHAAYGEERRWLELLGKVLGLAVAAAGDPGGAERSALVSQAVSEAFSALGPLVRRAMYAAAAQGDVDEAMAGLEADVLQVAERMAERGRAS
jgi:hypothetical protein